MQEKAIGIAEQVREYRRYFHMHPELGFEEVQTSEKLAITLEELGLRVTRGVGRTGIVAELGDGKPVIGIRADMDALPIQEANDVPYVSKIPGVMHACGHDAHMAIAMGVATLLKGESFSGTVRFLFQPSEEKEDEEGISGAPRMIEDGAMEGVDAIVDHRCGRPRGISSRSPRPDTYGRSCDPRSERDRIASDPTVRAGSNQFGKDPWWNG
jgi:amidohydrolase